MQNEFFQSYMHFAWLLYTAFWAILTVYWGRLRKRTAKYVKPVSAARR